MTAAQQQQRTDFELHVCRHGLKFHTAGHHIALCQGQYIGLGCIYSSAIVHLPTSIPVPVAGQAAVPPAADLHSPADR